MTPCDEAAADVRPTNEKRRTRRRPGRRRLAVAAYDEHCRDDPGHQGKCSDERFSRRRRPRAAPSVRARERWLGRDDVPHSRSVARRQQARQPDSRGRPTYG
jgi:hypothetical protein